MLLCIWYMPAIWLLLISQKMIVDLKLSFLRSSITCSNLLINSVVFCIFLCSLNQDFKCFSSSWFVVFWSMDFWAFCSVLSNAICRVLWSASILFWSVLIFLLNSSTLCQWKIWFCLTLCCFVVLEPWLGNILVVTESWYILNNSSFAQEKKKYYLCQ